MTDKTLNGGPTKRFFVSMLTRDIELDDAILDLIDNSVDGAMRNSGNQNSKFPYQGFRVELDISEAGFAISDNCGGIPDDRLEAAFRLGRPLSELDADLPTIGMYGIGMKRSIFKMGLEAFVESSSSDGVRKVTYSRKWLDDDTENSDNEWELEIERGRARKKHGVDVIIPTLRSDIKRSFSNIKFIEEVKSKISSHFGYIILRGFQIKVNGNEIKPNTLQLYYYNGRKNNINPYDYVTHKNGVRIRVTVGFYRPLPRQEEIDDDQESSFSKSDAGISVICNDRVILPNDTTFRTGWGTRTVPRFHNQFMAISGLISFVSNDANALPVSTTKSGIEMESEVYDHALTYCAEGIKIFTAFTNKWKGQVSNTAEFFEKAKPADPVLEMRLAESSHGKSVRKEGSRFKPTLPTPNKPKKNERRISFSRPISEIDLVSEYLFNEVKGAREAGEVGIECFERSLQLARETAS